MDLSCDNLQCSCWYKYGDWTNKECFKLNLGFLSFTALKMYIALLRITALPNLWESVSNSGKNSVVGSTGFPRNGSSSTRRHIPKGCSINNWNTGLFEMIIGVLTTCHTQYTWDRSICIFLFNRTTLQVFVTYLIGALYVVLLNKKKIQGYSKWLSGFWQLVVHNTLEIGVYVFFYLIEQHSKFLLHTL